jgi:hypothetical protein
MTQQSSGAVVSQGGAGSGEKRPSSGFKRQFFPIGQIMVRLSAVTGMMAVVAGGVTRVFGACGFLL